MASLPRSIMGGFSRIGRRRNHSLPSDFQPQHFQALDHHHHPEEWAFLDTFERQYGTVHPFFYACRLKEALKLAEEDKKLVFMYLHSPEHPYARSFCNETLRSEVVRQFLDVNFVCWGGVADGGEGLKMVATLRPPTFPFCAVIAPSSDGSLTLLQQIEGPVSASELVEILQRTMEEQGLAFGSTKSKQEEEFRAKQEEKIRADRRVREEQDAAYLAALQIDKEKEKVRNSPSKVEKPVDAKNARNYEKLKMNESATTTTKYQNKAVPKPKGGDHTQILIRFPNGERREQSFECRDKVQSIFSYIDSLGIAGIGNYRLVSNFPRKVYGVDQMRITLKDAGLYPKASLFLEPMPM
ncbi:plant UBX domain-containing protein 10-like [Senna tora]|uniref:Plant UBX domain-containing protein 10-like n=1 Tax=Senna tora TaxID=362788 RepID=A0A835CCV4_9FABA|nr:plant UBX domain-containing protein 10-like [Senna tora]